MAQLRQIPVLRSACKAAGVGRTTVHDWRNANPEFAAKMDTAMQEAHDRLEGRVYEAALDGDTGLMKWILSRRRPEVWGDRQTLEHTGPGGGPAEINVHWDKARTDTLEKKIRRMAGEDV